MLDKRGTGMGYSKPVRRIFKDGEPLPDRHWRCRYYDRCLLRFAGSNSPSMSCEGCVQYKPVYGLGISDIRMEIFGCELLIVALFLPEAYKRFRYDHTN